MRKFFIICILALGFSACQDKPDQSFSSETLAHELLNSEGDRIAFNQILDKHKGQVVLLDLWASWCSDCIKAIPSVQQLQKDFPDVAYVFISADKTQESWKQALQKYTLEGDHYFIEDGMKGTFGKSIDLDWIPRYILIDKQSNIVVYKAIQTNDPALVSHLKNLSK